MKYPVSFWLFLGVTGLTVLNIHVSLDYDRYRSSWSLTSWTHASEPLLGACHGENLRDNLPVMPLPPPRQPSFATLRSIPINANLTLEQSVPSIPTWIQEYFVWHAQRLAAIETHNLSWTQQKVLISQCLQGDVCGGTADRLRTFPTMLALAARTRRLLFVRWSRPMSLDKFLQGGPLLNWTLPVRLEETLQQERGNQSSSSSIRKERTLVEEAYNPEKWVVESAIQSGSSRFFREQAEIFGNFGDDKLLEERAFHDIWWGMFTPSSRVLALLEKYLTHLDLRPNEFAFAHYRAHFPGEAYRKKNDLDVLRDTTINAIHCAVAAVGPGYPIYMASDHVRALEIAQSYARESGLRIVTQLDVPRTHEFAFLSNTSDPLHLNFAQADDPSSFFPVFLDLMTFSLSRCASYGSGGFGRLGSKISYNASCLVEHSIDGKVQKCDVPLTIKPMPTNGS